MRSPATGWRCGWIAGGAFLALLLLTPPLAAESGSGWVGKPLVDALRALKRQGLRLVYSTHVVRQEMRVENEPISTSPPEILAELLAPHGLEARPAPGGRWLVVPAPVAEAAAREAAGVLEITARNLVDRAPLGGVHVRVLATRWRGKTDVRGRLRLAGLTAGVYDLEARRAGYETVQQVAVAVVGGESREVVFELVPETVSIDEAHEEIVVSSKYQLYNREPIPTATLSRETIGRLPHFGDDLYRAIAVLPGIATSDFSSRLHLRGGLYEEILVRIDGLELIEPFHLKDAQGMFSILDPELIDGVNLIPGSFSAEYGDRMTGVLDMTSAVPEASRQLRFGVSLTNAWLGGAGSFADGAGRLVTSLRRGYLDILFRGDDSETLDPRYWDAFGRLDYAPGAASFLSLSMLLADDGFEIDELDPPSQIGRLDSRYSDDYLRLSYGRVWGSRLFSESLLTVGRLDRDREVASLDYQEQRQISDRRRVDFLSVRQDWSWAPGDRHHLKWGVDLRRYEAAYAYENHLELRSAIAVVRHRPAIGATIYHGEVQGDQVALYLADRVRLGGRVVAELGGRWDRQTLTREEQWSPRLNLVWEAGRAGGLRFGWGYFHQSHRPHELDVEDGETEFSGAERAEHWSVGWERPVSRRGHLRLEAYRRRVDDPRPRYENLFDPFTAIPEAESDRIRVAPQSVHAEGVELFYSWRGNRRMSGWVSYALSTIEDRVGSRDQPRSIDQLHALKAALDLRPGPRWSIHLVWHYHSGWPSTMVTGELDEHGELVYVVGPHYAGRYPSYRRLDLRASRKRSFRGGELTFFLDLQNVFDRKNLRGYEYRDHQFVLTDGEVILRPTEKSWPGLIPSFGFSWSF